MFDSHLHIIDPRFPLVPNNGYLPPAFTAENYREQAAALGIQGGAIVSGSFQAFDQGYLLAALEALGPSFVGVTQLPADTSDAQILELDRAGVRAVRFNLRRGGSEGVEHLERFARRVHTLAGWHVELYVDARDLPPLMDLLKRLPMVVIDHLGLSQEGLPALLALAAAGVHVKATGFGRLDFAPGPVLQAIAAANPEALLFGTDLPSTRAPRAFESADIELISQALGPALAAKALQDNALALYRPRR
jgi:predicted TIM-barrel fold metal-dependent hydrolase